MRAQVQYVTANADQVGQRIDNFLLGHFKRVPKTRLYKAVRKGEVRVNGRRTKVTYRIQSGDEIRLPPLPQEAASVRLSPTLEMKQQVKYSIQYEDDQLVLINKPANLAVHSGSGIENGVIEIMRDIRGGDSFLELAHRLDRPTSGCLLIAKSRQQLLEIQQAMQENRVKKEYLCLVRGKWPVQNEKVDYRICAQMYSGMQKMVIDDSGKRAISLFSQVEEFEHASLMRAVIETGRTHQIRVHARAMGHPLAGDERYGDKDFNRSMKGEGLGRCFLHAQRIEYQTSTGKWRKFDCPLAPDLKQMLRSLRSSRT